jgi:hypothetical protein
VGACVLAFGGPIARAADEPSPSPSSAPLLEAAECASPSGSVASREVAAGQTLVTFAVAPTTRILLDADGAVVAVSTNTRCAPRPGDVFVVGDRPATAAERSAALAAGAGAGDWREPGAWNAVP